MIFLAYQAKFLKLVAGKTKAATHVHAHTYTQQGTRSWCSHWQDVSALDFAVPPSPSLGYRVGFFPCYFVSRCQHWWWWLIDLAGAAGFKTTTLAAAAQGNTEKAGWVNPRREETTLVICQLWESYNKLGITIFIVLKWKMLAEPGRSILNTLHCASARGPRAKALFLPAELFLTHLISPASAHRLIKAIPCLWGKGALYLPVPTVKIYYYSPTLKCKKRSSRKASPTAVSRSPGSPPSRWGSMRPSQTFLLQLLPPTSTTAEALRRFFSRSNVSPCKKRRELEDDPWAFWLC